MCSTALYPELIEYIYQFCDEFKTADEILAGKTVMYNKDNMNERMRKFIIAKQWFSDEVQIKAMIADGFEPFKKKVATRIFNQHKSELNLNLCPKCFQITRTPWAKQCRFCFHDWH